MALRNSVTWCLQHEQNVVLKLWPRNAVLIIFLLLDFLSSSTTPPPYPALFLCHHILPCSSWLQYKRALERKSGGMVRWRALTFFFLCFGSLPRRRSLKGAGDCGYSFLSRGVPSLSGLSGHLEALRCSWGYQAFGSAPLALVVVFVCYLDLTRFLAQLCQKEAALQCLQ